MSEKEFADDYCLRTELEKLMVRQDFKDEGFNWSDRNGLHSPFGARLSKVGKLANKRATVTAVHHGKREVSLKKTVTFALLEHA